MFEDPRTDRKTIKVRSKNADYQKFEVLKTNRNKRYKYFEFFIEGVRNINEAIKNNWGISSLIFTNEKPLSDWAKNILADTKTDVNYELTGKLMRELSGKEERSELMAVVKMQVDDPSPFLMPRKPIIALFDRPSNKGNLGTIIRSCDALGVDGLIITGHAVDLYDVEVIVSSMGSFFKVPVVRMAKNEEMISFVAQMKEKYHDFKVVGTTAHASTYLYDENLDVPIMLMLGNETEGLSQACKDACDVMVTIPMAEGSAATSFNVGCAATVLLYEAVRQRK